jgi:hypothetical protein
MLFNDELHEFNVKFQTVCKEIDTYDDLVLPLSQVGSMIDRVEKEFS